VTDYDFDPEKDRPITELMDHLIPQARAVAWKHWHSAPYVLEFDELVSLAYKGLTEAHNRWPVYCAKNGFDPSITRFFSVYCLRRMTGSILDFMRSQDWVSRQTRNNARALRDAGQDLGRTEAEMATATGLTRDEVSQTLAAMARRPVQFDPVDHDVRDETDTESRAVVDDLLNTAVTALEDQPVPVQFAVILTFYSGLSVKQAANLLGLDSAEVARMQQTGALAVHRALTGAAGKDRALWR
jgi:RNA polymerase sigma factor for flagellar operon FliA